MTAPDIRTALVRLTEVAEATADSFNVGLMNDAIDAATAALNAEPSENVPIPDHASMLAFACGREPWATWLKSGGSLESAHLELSDLMLAVLAQWGQSTPPAPEPQTPPTDDAWWHELINEIARVQHVAAREGQGGRMDLAKAVESWCRPATPLAPEPGVGELVQRLDVIAAQIANIDIALWGKDAACVARAATLLQQQAPEVPEYVARLGRGENEVRVIIANMADELDYLYRRYLDDNRLTHPLAKRARLLLAHQGCPVALAVPDRIMRAAEVKLNPGDYNGSMVLRFLKQARSAVLPSQGEGPSREEVLAALRPLYGDQSAADMGAEDDLRTAHVVLARWGHSAPQAPMSEEMQGLVIDLNEVSLVLGTRWPRLSTSLIRAADVLQQQSTALATLRIAHEADQGKVEETVDALVKAEATLTDVVEGKSPVDCGPSNDHNYFAEQCGHLEAGLEKCEELLESIRSVIKRHEIGKHIPSSTVAPVSVNERLPEPGDLDVNGRCWVYQNKKSTTYWLPHDAIPLPQNVGVLSSDGGYEAGNMWVGHTRPNSDASGVEQAATMGDEL